MGLVLRSTTPVNCGIEWGCARRFAPTSPERAPSGATGQVLPRMTTFEKNRRQGRPERQRAAQQGSKGS